MVNFMTRGLKNVTSYRFVEGPFLAKNMFIFKTPKTGMQHLLKSTKVEYSDMLKVYHLGHINGYYLGQASAQKWSTWLRQ